MNERKPVCFAGALLAIGLSLAGCSEAPSPERAEIAAALARVVATEQDHVTTPQLADWIIQDRRDYELIDIRESAEFAVGHIDGARHIPLAELLSPATLAQLPAGRALVVYSNGTAHAAQAALLLRLVERDAYALLGGYNYWQAYLSDPHSAGVAAMDPAAQARYRAVACYFAGDYDAVSGLMPAGAATQATPAAADPLGLGLGLGLGSEQARTGLKTSRPGTDAPADPLGLGLELGLGSDRVKALRRAPPADRHGGDTQRLLIKAEC